MTVEPAENTPPNSSRSLWVAVGLLFGMMAVAWYFLFTLAADNPVESVPLEHRQEP
ncbi:MAG: hypothetical protein SynsKO_05690 [Synoicihabitans sp.]